MGTTKHHTLNGISYAEGVEPAPHGNADADFLAELGKKPKIRITTMIDEDVYDMLKKRAVVDGDGRYQTYLNQLLRETLFNQEFDKIEIKDILEKLNLRIRRVEKRIAAKKATTGGKPHSRRA